MKYIYYIMVVMVVALALIVVQFFEGRPDTRKKPAIIINDKVITLDEFAGMKPSHDEHRAEFINSLIARELLIQEAQRTGIDKEENFRRSLQGFYEQSLVKVLMDRKFSSLKVTVSDDEISKYSALLGKKLDLTVYTAANAEDLRSGKAGSEKRTVAFSDLSRSTRVAVAALNRGEKSGPVQSGDNYIVLQLDDVKPGGVKPPGSGKEEIRKLIGEQKREGMIADWVEGLRKNARIQVLVSGNNGG
jgi:hypothetical protein